jgi:hypothetical protein
LVPLLYYDVARTALDFAKDMQGLIAEEGTARPMDGATLERTVAGYASASAAVFAYLDALVADQFVGDAGVSAEQSRALFAQFELEYELGRGLNAISGSSSRGASIGAKLMRLAGERRVSPPGEARQQYYSLGGRPNKDGKFGLENRQALAAQMDPCQSARTAARAARIGFIPARARRISVRERRARGQRRREAESTDRVLALRLLQRARRRLAQRFRPRQRRLNAERRVSRRGNVCAAHRDVLESDCHERHTGIHRFVLRGESPAFAAPCHG